MKNALNPQEVFHWFARINQIPRPSKREEKMIAFLEAFGKERGFATKVDEAGNVCITKDATPGMENRKKVILQSHFDMVCEKRSDVDFDFDTDAIKTYVEGEWMKAEGTTLGADDGIGVAMQLAVLDAKDLVHGPSDCVFTRDEETGLTGAMGMKEGFMSGDYLINLDSEDEGILFVSCAGGARSCAEFPWHDTAVPENSFAFRIGVKGLTGGHSGDDIEKGRGNANKILVQFLLQQAEENDLRLADIQSGGLVNAIPREGWALCTVPWEKKEAVRISLNVFIHQVEEELSATEPNLELTMESADVPATVMEREEMMRMLKSLHAVANGVMAMSHEMEGLVETSSNLASIKKEGEKVTVRSSQRSSKTAARDRMISVWRAAMELGGATVSTGSAYPGWAFKSDNAIVKQVRESYVRLFQTEPLVKGIHAGLECGLFSEKYPQLQMVSMGPTMRGVHSPDERLHIPSVQKVWDLLLDVLEKVD